MKNFVKEKTEMKLKTMFSVLVASFLFTYGLHFILKLTKFRANYWSVPLSFLGITIFILFFYKITERKSWKEYGIKKISLQEVKYSFFFLFLLFPIAFLGRMLDPSFDLWYAQQTGLFTLQGLFFSLLLLPLFVIKEEIFERSLIQSKLSQVYGRMIVLLLVSLNFAFMHFYITKNMQHIAATVVSVFFGSLVLVLLYDITKNLFATLLTHLLYDFLVVLQIYLHAKNFILSETLFWILFGIFFLITVKKTWNLIQEQKPKKVSLSLLDWVFFIVFVSLPLVLYFLF